MEARLFFISLWCGVYGQLLRVVIRRNHLVERRWITILMNSLFWATGAAILGMIIASYSEKMDQTLLFSAIAGGVGFLLGGAVGFWRGRDIQKADSLLRDDLEWADTGFSALLLASLVMFFVVQAFKIPSGSMRMTFVEGDHLFVNKFIYGIPIPFSEKKILPIRKVAAKDIVIFRYPSDDKDSPHYGKDFIKRTIALAGQKLQIVNKQVYVDGVMQEEPYTQHTDPALYRSMLGYDPEVFQRGWESGLFARGGGNDIRDNFGPVVVPEGHIFVMGDNRDHSFDSRFWGPLPLSNVKGKAWILYLPLKRIRLIH